MPKRDATQLGAEEEKEERGAKQPRGSEGGEDVTTAAAAAASSAPASSISASSSLSLLSSSSATSGASGKKAEKKAHKQVRVCTRKLVKATRGGKKLALSQRMQATCALLKEDNERAESMLDMSMQLEGDEDEPVCAFFHLLRLFAETGIRAPDDEAMIELKNDARQLFKETLAPLLPRLLSSFDPSLTDAVTGDNALHALLQAGARLCRRQ